MSIMGGREIVLEHRTLFRYNDRFYIFQHSFKCFVVVIGTIGGISVVCKQYLQTYWKQSSIVFNRDYHTNPFVIYLDCHSTKRALWLVDSWLRAPDQIQVYPDRETIPELLPAPDVLLRLLKEKSKYLSKHLMYGPSGNSLVLFSFESWCFPRLRLGRHQTGLSGKQNWLFPSGPYIKCIIFFVDHVGSQVPQALYLWQCRVYMGK